MKQICVVLAFLGMVQSTLAQEIVQLKHKASSEVTWDGDEKDYYSDIWHTQVVTNVSVPTMEVFRPKAEVSTGTSVIVAPGGGLYALSINSEGNDVAEWLNEKGITAFVLKYRLVPTAEDGVAEIMQDSMVMEKAGQVLPLSVADGLAAISHVRENAKEYNIDPTKIGFMGFSAGGAVTMGVTFNYTKENRPDFIVPVYAWMNVVGDYEVPIDAPPMLAICASDDPLLLAPASVTLYSDWLKKGKPVGLHMYSKGGHGFGMKEQGLPSDHWIQRFYDWSIAEKITVPLKTN